MTESSGLLATLRAAYNIFDYITTYVSEDLLASKMMRD